MKERDDDVEGPDEPSGRESSEGEADEADESDPTPDGGEEDEPRIASVREKVGEGPGNLGRREGWFRRRTGGGPDDA